MGAVAVIIFCSFVNADLFNKIVKHRHGELCCVAVFSDQIDPYDIKNLI